MAGMAGQRRKQTGIQGHRSRAVVMTNQRPSPICRSGDILSMTK